MRLESGPAKGDRYYWGFVTLLCVGLTAWFGYDGAVGWPQKNLKEARRQIPTKLGRSVEGLTFGERPTQEDFKKLAAARPTTLAEVEAALGSAPQHHKSEGDVTTTYFVSQYGLAVVPHRAGRVQAGELSWLKWYKNQDEIQSQFYWMLVPAAFGVYALLRFLKAQTLRVAMDDEALTYAGQRIPYAQMTGFDNHSPKGWVDLVYRENTTERRLRLDNQRIAKYDEVVELISQTRGFENPLRAPVAAEAGDDNEDESRT
ncbi:MAG: hypothetical protein AB7Q17_06640 [Phycisphaerae bacterium]